MRRIGLPTLMLLACAACASPADVATTSDIVLRAEDAEVVRTPDGFGIRGALPISVTNHGDRPVRYLRHCGGAGLKPVGGEWISISGACALARLDEVRIQPGETVVDSIAFSKPLTEWAGPIRGEFVLGVMLFVEGRSNAELVTSSRFTLRAPGFP